MLYISNEAMSVPASYFSTSSISFIGVAEFATFGAYTTLSNTRLWPLAEVVGRLVGAVLLSPAAALDLGFHTIMICPTCVYAIGKSIYMQKFDLVLPWQHFQRVRNAVSPLLLGSAFSVLHPLMGIAMTEQADKHIVMGLLSTKETTACSPITAYKIVDRLLRRLRAESKLSTEQEYITETQIKLVEDVKNIECFLQFLHGQELLRSHSGATEAVMGFIVEKMGYQGCLSGGVGDIAIRLTAVCIPILTVVDVAIGLSIETLFLASGLVRLISGRGPIYTEMTSNPLLHVALLVQNIFKVVGNAIATVAWLVAPEFGLGASRMSAMLFFEVQMRALTLSLKLKMKFLQNDGFMAFPVTFGNGEPKSLSSLPCQTMHTTYVIVEKNKEKFNLYWVNRSEVKQCMGLSSEDALGQMDSMLRVRFNHLNLENLQAFPITGGSPQFTNSDVFVKTPEQSGPTNCSVSNLFGMIDAVDIIVGKKKNENDDRAKQREKTRNIAVKSAIQHDYGFYAYEFYPFGEGDFPMVEQSVWNRPPSDASI